MSSPYATPASSQFAPQSRDWQSMAWAVLAAFGTYFCMYAFRKPFSVAEFSDVSAWGWEFKTVAVSAQVMGYTLSKFLGIKFLSELAPQRRAAAILVLIGFAELMLLGFGVVLLAQSFGAIF